MAKVLLRYLLAMFVAFALLRLAFGEPVDRHFLAGSGGFVVAMIVVVLIWPFLAPRIVSNREFFAAMSRRASRIRRSDDSDAPPRS